MRCEVDGVRVDARLPGSRGAGETGRDAHHLGAAYSVLPRDELVGGNADCGGRGSPELRRERVDRAGNRIGDAACGADRPRGVVLVRLVDAERRERSVARKRLGHAAVAPEEGSDLVEDPPLDHPQTFRVELALASGDLVELHVHDAHEAPVRHAGRDGLGSAGRDGRRGDGGRVERRVVAQDRPLELTQRRTRLEPVLVAQQRAELAIAASASTWRPARYSASIALALQPLAQRLCRGAARRARPRVARARRARARHRCAPPAPQTDTPRGARPPLREPRIRQLGEGVPRQSASAARSVSTGAVRVAIRQRRPASAARR